MIDFITPSHEVELVSDLLWSLGVVAIEERSTETSDVVLRTSMGADPDAAISQVVEIFPAVRATRVEVARSVADTWREHAIPTWVTETVALVPAWLPAPDNCTPIFVEPHDTFGLGNHPTTVLALQLALTCSPEGSHIFDLGCGSGVLAIALAKLRGCSVQVHDIAANAKDTVRMNCELNGVTSVTWSEGIRGAHVDGVLANILAPVLIEYASSIQEAISTGGFIVLSGMRTEQVTNVVRHYESCSVSSTETLDGWTAVVLRKN